ncbi:carboxylate/amino acid/amine transporter [Jannaschia seosinensis]|uniref:Carboxylate/amino acid/amine transporter n=1 Tax=Jannaschia seosinensis TaxID=313367 RepID=A0A0M7BDJ9_9RHOB|nr:DMT family transporter [Jannaschia seosinensis]CUH39425.1 carboxylate/amino acid/amine transporter [Jannaschia seosinensis]
MPDRDTPLPGILTALGAFALFAAHDVVIKTLGVDYAVFQIVFFSVLSTFPFVTFMLLRDAEVGTLIPRHPWWSALRTLSAVITGFTAFYAFSSLPLAQVYAILFAAPLVITILSIPILGEKVGIHRGAAVIVGLVGVMIVLRPGTTHLALGHAAALAAAVFGALTSVIVRKIGREERAAVLMLYPMMANFLVMGILMPFVYRPMPLPDLGLWLLMAALAFLGGLGMIQAYRRADAVLVAPMQYSQIIWAAIYGWLFFGESVDGATALGAAVIIASGLYIVLREGRGGRSTNTPVLRTRSRPETGTAFRIGRMLSEEERSVQVRPNR